MTPTPPERTPPDERAPRVRVVCVTYHPGPELDDFLGTLTRATDDHVHVVLVENGDDPARTAQVADRHGAELVVPGSNLGYGGGANLGARGGDEPWVVVANPDIVWSPGSLDVLLEAAERHPGAGALGPALLNTDGTRYPSARALPSLRQGIGHALLVRVWPGNPWTRAYRRDHETSGRAERTAGWLSGACLLLRREAFEAVGGFDEDYFMFFEDVDLGRRLGEAGWTNLHLPAAEGTHRGGASWGAPPAGNFAVHPRSARRFLLRPCSSQD